MSTASQHVEVAIIGAGVVGCAVALAFARRDASVVVLEAESEPGLGASGTNSGILHTGFDSAPGDLETELILASATLRDEVLTRLDIPVLRCGAEMRAAHRDERSAVAVLADAARRNRVSVIERGDGVLEIPGEAVTDPVLFTLALAGAAISHGAELRTGRRVTALRPTAGGVTLGSHDGGRVDAQVVVNCAGLEADAVARMAGDDSFQIYPRKGEFLVFDAPDGRPLERILLPVPDARTKGVLVFPTLDGKIIAGPTAADGEDKGDWAVRPSAAEEILGKAAALYPGLRDAEPVMAYAGLRPAGRGANYIIAPSHACRRMINVAAIRSTGLTASLGIAEHVVGIVAATGLAPGVPLGPPRELVRRLRPASPGPWWRRTADFRGVAA